MRTAVTIVAAIVAAGVLVAGQERGAAPPGGGEGRGRGPAMKLSDPVITDPAIQNGGIDMHAHQDPDSNGPSYGRYETPLHAGVEGRRLFVRGDWVQIELAGGEVGWLPREHVLVDER